MARRSPNRAGELRRAIENVEVACGIPTLMQGYNLEDVARGIDETMIRQPLGVTAAITPFNFPAMIPFWFLPYAIACGNTFILKPSEKVPLTAQRIFEILEELKLPAGVVNLVHGGRAVVDALLDIPDVRAISFVGSTAVARHIYAQAALTRQARAMPGRREKSCAGSAGCGHETASRIISDSAFGCAGQRCLAVSVAVTVGEAREKFTEDITAIAARLARGQRTR